MFFPRAQRLQRTLYTAHRIEEHKLTVDPSGSFRNTDFTEEVSADGTQTITFSTVWAEDRASLSEAIVKAERDEDMTIEKLQADSVKRFAREGEKSKPM